MPSKWAKKSGGGGLSLGALGLVGKLGGGPRVGVALAASTVCALALTGKLPGGGGGAKKVTRAKRVTPPEQRSTRAPRPTRPRRPPTSATDDLWLVRRTSRRPPAAARL